MSKIKIIFILVIVFILASDLSSARKEKDDFTWEPITDIDWAVQADSVLNIKDAAIIFQKIEMDDRDMIKENCYYTLYKRIRILTADGREYGDFAIPVYSEDQKILSIKGRAIRRDGDTTALNSDQIVEKEIFKSGKTKIRQKSFSIPGLSDDCIIEYRIKIKLPSHINKWDIQDDIALLHGELSWFLYYGKGMSDFVFKLNAYFYAPNYLTLCLDENHEINVEKLPSLKETKQLVFTIDSLPAFKKEPYSLPEQALRGQLHYYYAEVGAPATYWGQRSQMIPNWLTSYIDESKQIKKIVSTFENVETNEDKIKSAYNWVTNNLINLTFEDTEKKINFKKYETADKAIKSGYAKRLNINYIFCDMLREMNIDAKVCWVVDRDDALFVQDAKYWQFSRTLIAVQNEDKSWSFYCPGEKFMPIGSVPWFNEGVSALLGGAQLDFYVSIPFSNSSDNNRKRTISLKITDDFNVTGVMNERIVGHEARGLRVKLNETQESSYATDIKEYIKDNYYDYEIDTISYQNTNSYEEPLEIGYQVHFPNIENDLIGDRILLKPLKYMEKIENPFVENKRTQAVILDYPYESHESLSFEIPETMQLEALPENVSFQNQIGSYGVNFTQVGNMLSVQRVVKMSKAYILPEDYNILQDFLQQVVNGKDLTVSLLYEE